MAQEDAETRMIWRFLGRILSGPEDPDAIDGREYFYAHADENGDVGRVEFIEMVCAIFKRMATSSGLVEAIAQSGWKIVGSIDASLTVGSTDSSFATRDPTSDPHFEKFKVQCYEKMDDLFPILAQSLFRFFDVDGSGAVSKDEFIAGMSFLKTIDGQKSTFRIETALRAVFRLLDQNGNGTVEASEVTNFLVDINNCFCNLIAGIIDEFGPYFVKVPLRALFDNFAITKGFGNSSFGYNETIYLDETLQIVQTFIDGLTDEIPASPTDALVSGLASAADWSTIYQKFLAEFEKNAVNGEMPKAEVVKIANQLLMAPVLELVTFHISAAVAQVRDLILKVSNDIDDQVLTDAIIQTVSSIRMYVRAGGMKKLLFALMNCVDADNNEIMTLKELTEFWGAAADLWSFYSAGGSKSDLKAKTEAFVRAVWFLADANGDGVLSMDEVYQILVKLFDFSIELLECVVHTLRNIISCISLPLVLLAFDMKAKVFGSSALDFTQEDLAQLCAAASA